MKIAVIGPQFPDSFAHNITATLQEMGHATFTSEGRAYRHDQNRYYAAFRRYLPKVLPVVETSMHSRMLQKITDEKPGLVLVTYDFFSPAMVSAIKRAARCPVVCWYIDPPANLHGGRLFLCDYDAFFAKEPSLVDTMAQKLRLPAHYLPEACNPKWHRPVVPTSEQRAKYGCDIVAQ